MNKFLITLSVKSFAIGTFCLLIASLASALTFGPMKIKSQQGQPLRAEIEILSMSQEEAKDFTVKLASQNDHLRMGFDWRAVMSTISVDIDKGGPGRRPLVRLQSAAAVDVEKLSLALIVESSMGRARKEFVAEVPASLTSSPNSSDQMKMLANR
jgi:pilus assembly protein FimV